MATQSSDDLIWKIWEIEEQVREKQAQAERLRQVLRDLKKPTEGAFELEASGRITGDHRVTTYAVDYDRSRFALRAVDRNEKPRLEATWKSLGETGEKGPPSEVSARIHDRASGDVLELECAGKACKLLLNGEAIGADELEDAAVGALLSSYRRYLEDFLVVAVEHMQPADRARAASNAKVKAALEAINTISCVCAGFWPFGTAICGPTCVGTTIAIAADP